jgi:hypothetical protein
VSVVAELTRSATVLVVGRGSPVAAATTLATLAFDAAQLIQSSNVIVVDDRPGYASTGPLTDLARRYSARYVAVDEFTGWSAIDIGMDAVASGPMVIIEAGTLVRPAALLAALDDVARDPSLVYVVEAVGDDIPYELMILDRSAWPTLPAFRGFGGIGDTLERSWLSGGRTIHRLDPRLAGVEVRRCVDDRSLIRNVLIGEHWNDGDHQQAVSELANRFGRQVVDEVGQRLAGELASPLADADAIFWIPENSQRGGWPAAWEAFHGAGIEQLVRRLPRLEVSILGAVREVLMVGAVARRSLTRRWSSTVIIEGAFALCRPPDVGLGGGTADVVFLDDTTDLAGIAHPLAMMIRPPAAQLLAARLPQPIAEVIEWVESGGTVEDVIRNAIAERSLSASTRTPALIQRIPSQGPWLRW